MSNTIQCPECGADIDVNELLYQELDKQAKEKYQTQLNSARAKLNAQQADLEQQQQSLDSTVEEKLQQALAAEKKVLQEALEQQQQQRIESMQTELDDYSKKLENLNKTEIELEKLKRQQQSMRSEMALELEKQYSKQLAEERQHLQTKLNEENQFKVAEKEQLIKQLQKQLSEAQRQAEQGSVQLQGEVQELAIESWLRDSFPLDSIEEVKKGAQGADVLQTVNSHNRQNCGLIYYESKRTKAFSHAWIEKFKSDLQERGADIGVLVTQTMPADISDLGQINGIWVCHFEAFKNLSQVLRHSLIELSRALVVQENKGDKMGMLYDFLTGQEFRMQIEAIVEGFTELKTDLEKEKRAMQGAWKRREKQLDRVLLNTNFMYNSIRGIAGNAVQKIPSLEHDNDG